MKIIYRYELELIDQPVVPMPKGAQVLSVSHERERLECWALVDPMVVEVELREFRVVGTGNPAPDDLGRFIGTVMVYDGRLVFHVFEAAS